MNWEEVPEALKLFVVRARLAGIPARVTTDWRGGRLWYAIIGPNGHVSAPEWFGLSPKKHTAVMKRRLLCSNRMGLLQGPRTYRFDVQDEPACRQALINIGLVEPPATQTGRWSSKGPNLQNVPRDVP